MGSPLPCKRTMNVNAADNVGDMAANAVLFMNRVDSLTSAMYPHSVGNELLSKNVDKLRWPES